MTKWKIDPMHATAVFKVQHIGFAIVPGTMTGITGESDLDLVNFASGKVTAEIDTTTIDTGLAPRDNHLKSADFLDVENYPKMTFESTAIQKVDAKHFKLQGNLTIKNITKEIETQVEFLGEGDKVNMDGTTVHVAAFILKAAFDRRDFGLTWNVELPGNRLLVGNQIAIEIDIELLKQ